jgi:Tol biopolymer transport system component
LLYSSGGQQHRVNLDTGTSEVIGAAPPAGSVIGPGNALIWVEKGPEPEEMFAPRPFRVIQSNIDGSEQRVLLDSSVFYQQFSNFTVPPFSIVLSAEQAQLLFAASSATGAPSYGYTNFFALNLSSGQVTDIGQGGIAWSGWVAPDGQGRVFARRNGATSPPTYPVVYVASGDPEAEEVWLTEHGGVTDVTWLPDKHFLYASDAIILANPQGETVRRLAELSEDVYAPWVAVSPDQQQVAYLIEHTDDAMSLWLVNLDGSGLRQVMDLPSDVTDLTWR